MKFVLPMPPSINQTYGVNRDGNNALYKKRPVKDWEHEAGWEIKKQWRKQTFKPFVGYVQVGIHWFYKVNRDIDASMKILLDIFQKIGVYQNDRQVRSITKVLITEDKLNPRVEVEINEMV